MTAAAASPLKKRLGRSANIATFLAAAATLGLSSMTLTALGVGYDTQGGNPLAKLHPASWLFGLALLLNLLSKPSPRAYLEQLPRSFPGAAFFVAMWVVTVAFAHQVQHAPATPLIDTFFPALAILLIHRDLDRDTQTGLSWFAHGFMFVNACLGILEFLLHFRLTPYVVGGVAITEDLRSTALLGHPLLNAGSTGAYVLILFFGGETLGRAPLRALAIALQMVAMIAFGGRTAIVLGLAVLAVGSLPGIAAVLAGRRFDQRVGLLIALGLPLLIGAAYLAVSGGFLENLIDRSSTTRIGRGARGHI